MANKHARVLKAVVVGSAAALMLAACGIRGPLELPPDAKESAKKSGSGQPVAGSDAPKAPEPHRGLILDGLIR